MDPTGLLRRGVNWVKRLCSSSSWHLARPVCVIVCLTGFAALLPRFLRAPPPGRSPPKIGCAFSAYSQLPS